jgi:hypothetical protein
VNDTFEEHFCETMAPSADDVAYGEAITRIVSFCLITIPTRENSRMCPKLNQRLFRLDFAYNLLGLEEHHYVRFVANKKTFTFRQTEDTGEWLFHYTKVVNFGNAKRQPSVPTKISTPSPSATASPVPSISLPKVSGSNASFNPTKLDSAIANLLSRAALAADNSLDPEARGVYQGSQSNPNERKLFFKVSWVKSMLHHQLPKPPSVEALIEYLKYNDKFIVNQECVHFASAIAVTSADKALLKKVDNILGVRTESVTLHEIHSLLSKSFPKRVGSVPALKTFLAGYPSKYKLASNVVRCVGMPMEQVLLVPHLNSHEEEALITSLAFQLLNMPVFGKYVPFLDLKEYGQRTNLTLTHVANKYQDMFLLDKPKMIRMPRPMIPPSCHKILEDELKQILSGSPYSLENNAFKLDKKTEGSDTGFLFSWVAEELIRRKSVIELLTPVAVEELKAFVTERPDVFWTVDNCVNLISRVNEEAPISQLDMHRLVSVLENSAFDQKQCYIGQGMKLFWCQTWVRTMLPDLPWNRLERSAMLSNSAVIIDSGQCKGIYLVNDTYEDPKQICKRELVAGRILQYIGEEFGLILANGKIISFIMNCVCNAGKYVNENYDVREHLYVGKQVQAVVDYKIEVDKIPMAISVSTDGKLDLMRPISWKLQLLLKSKFHEVMRGEWLATLPNGVWGRSLREPLLNYNGSVDPLALEIWMSAPVFKSHVLHRYKSMVFDKTLLTSTSTLLRLILPENKALRQLYYPTNVGGNYADLPLPIMSSTPKMNSTSMGSLSLLSVTGSVWRTRKSDGVEIIITAPDRIMFSVLYANTDESLGPVYDSLVVGSIVSFNLSGHESSCGAITPSISNLEVSSVDHEIEKASVRVLAGDARYVGHLDTAKVVEVAEEVQNDAQIDHMAVLDDIPVLPLEDAIICDVGDADVMINYSSTEEKNHIEKEET